uniref:Uncharacterized protein n=1 Tax=Arundo donax TaxID=35708 RepID=A0A0A8ZQR4_ARUDO
MKERVKEKGQDEHDGAWQTVRGQYWWRKQRPSVQSRLEARREPSRRLQSIHGRLRKISTLDLQELFKRKAEGRCFRCLASNHRVALCRDPLCCIVCLKYDQRARHCRAASASALTSTAKSFTLPPRVTPPTSHQHHKPPQHHQLK